MARLRRSVLAVAAVGAPESDGLQDGRHIRLSVSFGGVPHGLGIWTHRDDHITRVMADSGRFYEDCLLSRLFALGPTGIYIDVGAHIGVHTLCFASYFPCHGVIAIEPDPGNFEVLCKNAQAVSHRVTVCRAGAGRIDQRWAEVMDRKADNSGMKQLRVCRRSEMHGPEQLRDLVPIVQIDDLVDDLYGLPAETSWRAGDSTRWSAPAQKAPRPAPIGLIKIDVEGMELDVLSGAEWTIQTHRPILVIETITAGQTAAVSQFLRPYRYDVEGPYGATPTYIHRPKA